MDPISGALAGAGSILSALPGLFGTTTTTNQRSSLEFRPEDLARMEQGASQYQTGVGDLLRQIQSLQTGLTGGMPQAPSRFEYAGAADPVTRAIAGAARQDLLSAEAAQRKRLLDMYQGRPDVGGVLGSLLGMNTQLQQNQILGREMPAQFARQLSQAQLQQQQYNDVLRNLLAKTQTGANLATVGLGSQQNLAQFLADLATRRATTVSSATQEDGGLF